MRVTIGIPVYNGEATMARAIESALQQTVEDCLIHVSDNASTDGTAAIGRRFAKYPRVRFTRHEATLGISGNFRFVLQQATTPFFMWLAADDYILPTYAARTLAALDAHPEWIACGSRVLFASAGRPHRLAEGTYPLIGDMRTNLAAYLSNPSDNSRAFALHRTLPLQRAFPPMHLHAYDWCAVASALLYGGYGEIPDALMVREETPGAAYTQSVRRDASTRLGHVLPILPMTTYLLWRQHIPLTMAVAKALLQINVAKHIEYMRMYHRRYARATRWLWDAWRQRIAWRLRTAPTPSLDADDLNRT